MKIYYQKNFKFFDLKTVTYNVILSKSFRKIILVTKEKRRQGHTDTLCNYIYIL